MGLFRKTVLRADLEGNIGCSKPRFKVVVMATYCTIFAMKLIFLLQICRKEKSWELRAHSLTI